MGVDALARAVIFPTEHSSCTAIPCSSIMQASRETGRPHIQHVRGAFELDGIGCLQNLSYERLSETSVSELLRGEIENIPKRVNRLSGSAPCQPQENGA
jgi:hypothetical protein